MPFLKDLQIQDLESAASFLRIRRYLDRVGDGEGIYGIYGMYLRVNSDPLDVKTHWQSSQTGFYRVYRIPLKPDEIVEWKAQQRFSMGNPFVKEIYNKQVKKEKEALQ